MNMQKHIFIALIVFVISFTPATAQPAQPAQPEASLSVNEVQTAHGKDFMVVAANPHAVSVGYDVLKKGGNAIDAMIAVQAMLNLVEPQSSGIGGGSFLLYFDKRQNRLTTFDGRERAPFSARPDYWLDSDEQPIDWWDGVVGGRSVGVPGTLKLMHHVHQRYGKLPWAELLQPTIDLAERGFEISPRLAGLIQQEVDWQGELDKYAAARDYFFNPDGSPKSVGTVLRNPEFAGTLRLIASAGANAFYYGSIAREIVKTVRKSNKSSGLGRGLGRGLSLWDMVNYRVIEREPVCVPYRQYDICGMGPPSSGGVSVGQIMMILENFAIGKLKHDPVRAWHLFAEASKLAYADRGKYLADSDFVSVPWPGLLNRDYIRTRANLINPEIALPSPIAAGIPPGAMTSQASDQSYDRPGTSHFSIVDAEGNVVSMTSSIETGFGSRLMVGGFLLNNELTDFSFIPEDDQGNPIANRVEGGKRPRSSMSPVIVFQEGEPYLVLGSPGGGRIIAYVAQALLALLDWRMAPDEVVQIGHIVNRNEGVTELEQDTAIMALKPALQARGHKITPADMNSGLHLIVIDDNGLTGAADPRREGVAMGQ